MTKGRTYLDRPVYHCTDCGRLDIHAHRDLGDCDPLAMGLDGVYRSIFPGPVPRPDTNP